MAPNRIAAAERQASTVASGRASPGAGGMGREAQREAAARRDLLEQRQRRVDHVDADAVAGEHRDVEAVVLG
jgi:hypothetical protein